MSFVKYCYVYMPRHPAGVRVDRGCVSWATVTGFALVKRQTKANNGTRACMVYRVLQRGEEVPVDYN